MKQYLCLLMILTSQFVFAFSAEPEPVPNILKPWADWVLRDDKNSLCPFRMNNYEEKQCIWPGRLTLEVTEHYGHFSQSIEVFQQSWVTLVGDQQNWPKNVSQNGKQAVVISKNGRPSVQLMPGKYDFQGEFNWKQLPNKLLLPKQQGLLRFKLSGDLVSQPVVKKNWLWIKQHHSSTAAALPIQDQHSLEIYRKIDDSIPLQMTTFLRLNVSGKAREISLKNINLKDFIPVSMNSPLSAQLKNEGVLSVQVKPGEWIIQLQSRLVDPVFQLSLTIPESSAIKHEIWSYEARQGLRLAEIENVATVDPSQFNMPPAWKKYPAYLMESGSIMKFNQIRRGNPDPEPNQLRLERKVWLDFEGQGYTVSDHIQGKFQKDWRINAVKEMQVGRVLLNGENQLVTYANDEQTQGIQLRQGTVDIVAESRIVADISQINAVGWEQPFNLVNVELNLPPGWRLLNVSGVDNQPATMLNQWTLLDFFLVSIISFSIGKIWSYRWGLLSLITLVLCWHEAGAPQYIWLNILAATALIQVLKAGKLAKAVINYRYVCWLALVIIVFPFIVSQVRTGLYPQLEEVAYYQPSMHLSGAGMGSVLSFEEEDYFPSTDSSARLERKMLNAPKRVSQQSLKKLKTDRFREKAIDANIQTGPGLPIWHWNKVKLSWNGSVNASQQVSLDYLSPSLNRLLNFIRSILIACISLLVFGLLKKDCFKRLSQGLISPVLLIGLCIPQDGFAMMPDKDMLQDLKNYLLKAPDCLPHCSDVAEMQIQLESEKLIVELEAHVQETLVLPLPAKRNQWLPDQVTLNGKDYGQLISDERDNLWIKLEPGVHQIRLAGQAPSGRRFYLPITLRPHNTQVNVKGWDIQGLDESGKVESQLIFKRKGSLETVALKAYSEQTLPDFLTLERTLHIGLEWTVSNRLYRRHHNKTAVSLAIPLLVGESVTTSGIRQQDSTVLLNLAPNQSSVSWNSVLQKQADIKLTAPGDSRWYEVWRADISPAWHFSSEGISMIHPLKNFQGIPEWRPWPGETLQLSISRPKAVPGSTVTIDFSQIEFKPGNRTSQTELTLQIISSKGGQHAITLPEAVELQSVKRNQANLPVRLHDNALRLPLVPEMQRFQIIWNKSEEMTSWLQTPTLNLGLASVNNEVSIMMPEDRWVLFAFGPDLGPAVLFWGVLLVMMPLAYGLGKSTLTPLKGRHWFLLMLGLTQVDLIAALLVIFWLFALGYRAYKPLAANYQFNAVQILLAFLTLVSLVILIVAVKQELLGFPDMQIAGNQSNSIKLNWYQDRNLAELETASVISIPLKAYRLLVLIWAFWLSFSILHWLKWGWHCFSQGQLWLKEKPELKMKNDNTSA